MSAFTACFIATLVLASSTMAGFAGDGVAPPPVRILLVTGVDYPGHNWRETAPALAGVLREDKRLDVVTVEDPAFLDSTALETYRSVVLHFQNWEQPGPGLAARENLRRFVEKGGGLALVHFACGAWHAEWPEFGKLAGRVWAGPGPGVRQHDPFGAFRVEMSPASHPITQGLTSFETRDELYTCLAGEHPMQVLAEARSKVDGKMYPMAFVSRYGEGRAFHCVLGHDVGAFKPEGVRELYRRGVAWAAGLAPVDSSNSAR